MLEWADRFSIQHNSTGTTSTIYIWGWTNRISTVSRPAPLRAELPTEHGFCPQRSLDPQHSLLSSQKGFLLPTSAVEILLTSSVYAIAVHVVEIQLKTPQRITQRSLAYMTYSCQGLDSAYKVNHQFSLPVFQLIMEVWLHILVGVISGVFRQ